MIASLQNPLALLGRILIAALFVPAGWGKIAGFEGTVGYIGSVGLPLPAVAAAIAIVVELGGGLAILFGFGARLAALALAVFTLVASFFFHAYWAVPPEAAMMQQLMFFKNVAITGGLLVLAAFGPGTFSVDAKRARA